MKTYKFIFVLFLISCNRISDSSTAVRIVNNNVIFSPGDTCIIELYGPPNMASIADFYILSGQDTFALPYDPQKGCSIYKALHHIEKKHTRSGFVTYTLQNNIKKQSAWKISYEVKK